MKWDEQDPNTEGVREVKVGAPSYPSGPSGLVRAQTAPLPSRGRGVLKRTFWLDPDAYDKLSRLRQARREKRENLLGWVMDSAYSILITNIITQYVKRHGLDIPKKHKLNVSLHRNLALTLRHLALKAAINQVDILNMAIREYDETQHQQELTKLLTSTNMQEALQPSSQPAPSNQSNDAALPVGGNSETERSTDGAET